jgi:ferric-dicitrate binding protein FerR (iron transport regulator)
MRTADKRLKRTAAALSRRAFVGGVLGFGWLLALPRLVHAAAPVGRVNAIRGRATALLDGQSRSLRIGAEIFADEILTTEEDARLAIAMADQTEIKLGGSTRFIVEAPPGAQGGALRLEQGAILSDAPEAATGDVVVETPFAAISARGARLFVGPSNGGVGVFVERGSANVTNKAGEALLQAGQGTDLASPDIAPTPASQWGEARIAAALASVG